MWEWNSEADCFSRTPIIGGRRIRWARRCDARAPSVFKIVPSGHEPWREHGFVTSRSWRVQALARRPSQQIASRGADVKTRGGGMGV
jgi:hypothetical protein